MPFPFRVLLPLLLLLPGCFGSRPEDPAPSAPEAQAPVDLEALLAETDLAPAPEPLPGEAVETVPEPGEEEPGPTPEEFLEALEAEFAPPAPEEPAPALPPETPVEVRMPEVKEVLLSNGMRFLLVRRAEAPVFHGIIGFRVGGMDEDAGATGLAHMFEHMAFKGTRAVGTTDWEREKPVLDRIEEVGGALTALQVRKGDPDRIAGLRAELARLHVELHKVSDSTELDRIYSVAGERGLNAFTSKDWTCYHVSLPSNRLELWMLMESERLRDPVFREFYLERDNVAEERRMRTDTNPGGLLWERLMAAAFVAHPYRTPTIGWMEDIQGLSLEAAREFHFRHYSPDNAVGVLVGDLDPDRTSAMLERWFGRVPKRGSPPVRPFVEPPQCGERRVEVRFDASPSLMIAYHKPRAPHAADTAAELLSMILGSGSTSRLHRRLVLKDRIAAGTGAWNGPPGGRDDNLFVVSATPLEGHGAAECEAAILDEIARLAAEPVSAAELARVRARTEVSVLRDLATNEGLGMLLASNAVVLGDWREPWDYLERMRQVTPEDLQAFAAKYLVQGNRTVAVLRTEGVGKEGAK